MVNYVFWPVLSMVVFCVATIICCSKHLTSHIINLHGPRLHQVQLACEEGDVEKLSKYLVSRHLKTLLDAKCNLQHFRQNARVDINDKNTKNVSSLRCAVLGRKYAMISKSHLECIELLLIHGANIKDVTRISQQSLVEGIEKLNIDERDLESAYRER